MKIIVMANGEPNNPKVWSGIAYNITSRLEKYEDVEVVPINLTKLLGNRTNNFFYKLIGKFLYIRNTPRTPLRYRHDSAVIENEISKYNADICLFISEHCLYPNKKRVTKCYAYVDAILRPIFEYNAPKRIGTKQFLKGYEKIEEKCYKQLNGVFTLNEWCRNSINSLYNIDKSKIYNVGFGVNVNFYDGEKDYSLKHLLIVIRKGTEYYKGLDLLLEAFELLRERDNAFRLSVVGTDYKKVNGVTYYYNKPRDITVKLFREASLYVMPAVSEPNGITYLEALASKTPIVGLNRFAFPEFCGNGEYGFIVNEYSAKELADTIQNAFTDLDKLKEMGIKGYDFVKQKYKWDNVVETMMKIFKEDCNE